MAAAAKVGRAAARAEDSAVVEHAARLGLAARTLVWTTIALLALLVAAGRNAKPDQSGALAALRDRPLGTALLIAAAVGFLAYGGYRLLSVAKGHRDLPAGGQRRLRRAQSLGEAGLYLAAAGSTASFLLGGAKDSEQQTESVTARLMALPAGRWLVGVLGVAVAGLGVVMAYRAVREKHARDLGPRTPRWVRRPAVALGAVGMAGRGGVIALAGGFLVDAAARFDPRSAKGLDDTLQTLARQPFGTVLLLAAGSALLAFGIWSLAETLWRDV